MRFTTFPTRMVPWKAYILRKNLISIAAVLLPRADAAVNVESSAVFDVTGIAEVQIVHYPLVAASRYVVSIPAIQLFQMARAYPFAKDVMAGWSGKDAG